MIAMHPLESSAALVLQRIVARDQDPAKRARAARLLAALDAGRPSPTP